MRFLPVLVLLLVLAAPALADDIQGALYLPRPAVVTGTYFVERDDLALLVDCSGGSVTLWLPPASSSVGRVLSLLSVGAHGSYTISIRPRPGQTINGSTAADTTSLSAQWDRADYLSDGTRWFALTKYRTASVSAAAVNVAAIKSLSGVACATIATSTGKLEVTTAARVSTLGVGVAAPDAAGDAYINRSLGVGVAAPAAAGDARINRSLGVGAAAPGASGYITAATALNAPAVNAADGTSSWTIAASTGKSTATTAVRVPSLGVGQAASDTVGDLKVAREYVTVVYLLPSTEPAAPLTGAALWIDIDDSSKAKIRFSSGASQPFATHP